MDRKKILTIVLTFLIYLISTTLSYSFFSQNLIQKNAVTSPVSTSSNANDSGAVAFDQTLPKTEACPLNGVMYSKQQKDWWGKHRPLGVMIENHEEARPQSGLSSADVIYEAVAEGSITRFLAVFYCQDAKMVGPVRSARTYFLDYISEYGNNPLYSHVGGANTPGPADALGQIEEYGWKLYNDLSQFSLSFPIYWQDRTRLKTSTGEEVATEHTMYSATSKLWNVGVERGLTNVDKKGIAWVENFIPYTFKDDASISTRPESQTIHVEHWKGYGQYTVDWKYDKATNQYLRNSGGKPHLDKNTNKQLAAKNIIIISTLETNANDGYENNLHLLYKTKGTGKATIFMDGQKITGTWKKDKRTSRTLIFDSQGNPIKFNRGLIWFEILPIDGVVSVK